MVQISIKKINSVPLIKSCERNENIIKLLIEHDKHDENVNKNKK